MGRRLAGTKGDWIKGLESFSLSKEKNVSRTHQRNLGDIRGACPLSELQRKARSGL